jgi:hypothetical protein
MGAMPIRALVVEEKGARFEEQELALEDPGRGEALVSGRRFKGERAGTTAYTRAGQRPQQSAGDGAGVRRDARD